MSKLVSPKMPWDYQRKWHWEICRCWLVPLVSGEGLWSSGLLLTTQNSLTPSRLVSISFSSPNPTWKPNENISSRHTTHGNDCISKHHKMSTYSLQCQYPAKLREMASVEWSCHLEEIPGSPGIDQYPPPAKYGAAQPITPNPFWCTRIAFTGTWPHCKIQIYETRNLGARPLVRGLSGMLDFTIRALKQYDVITA